MKILLCSHTFSPNVGGIETVSKILAEQFTHQGFDVTVVTETRGGESTAPYRVRRNMSVLEILKLGHASDVILQSNISLRTLLPLLLVRKPIVVIHHTWLSKAAGGNKWVHHLKRLSLRLCTNVAVSRAIADELPVPCHILPNPLDRNEFPLLPDQQKDKDLLFVGRLVSDKGCSIFIRALSELKSEGLEFGATIMGDGSEVGSLKNLAKDLEVDSQIDFAGLVTHDRAQAMRRHKVLIVPSLWKEPFGLVAIEGIACGCAVIASDIGGLPEAVGPCGVLFEPGDVKSLASHIRELMQAAPAREAFVAAGAEHLKQFDAKDVAARYLSLFASLRE